MCPVNGSIIYSTVYKYINTTWIHSGSIYAFIIGDTFLDLIQFRASYMIHNPPFKCRFVGHIFCELSLILCMFYIVYTKNNLLYKTVWRYINNS